MYEYIYVIPEIFDPQKWAKNKEIERKEPKIPPILGGPGDPKFQEFSKIFDNF